MSILKRYLLESIGNMRDIGGYTIGNKKVKCGKLIRSNLPDNMTDEDISVLKAMGINTVIDLRTKEEIEKANSVFEKNPAFKLLHYKINGGGEIPTKSEDVPLSYMRMLEGKESIYQIFKEIEKANDGIIYFCNAGKDRTGVITALILMTLGAKKEDIISDYALSQRHLEKILNCFVKNSENEQIREIVTPKAEYMEKFLDQFYEKYGDINQYLHQIGITDNEINQIKEKYIEEK